MRNKSERAESLGYFNLAKGMGILLILAGHSITPVLTQMQTGKIFSGAGSVLGGGVIAAFFMISGFGFYKRSMKKCFSIQCRLLLRPYGIVAAAVLGTRGLLAILEQRSFLEHGGELVLTYLLGLNAEGGGTLLGIPIESVSIFWFVLALFVGWMIYNWVMQMKSPVRRTEMIVSCVILGYGLTLISKVWPFCLPMGLLAAGYLAAGRRMREKRLLERKLPVWCMGILLGVAGISAAFGQVNIVACVWKLGIIDVAGSFCVGFLLLRLYAWFMKKQGDQEKTGRIRGLIEEVGFYSIWIVCLHAYEKIIIPWYRVYGILRAYPWLAVAICFIGRCLIMYGIYKGIFWIKGKQKRKGKKPKIRIEE